MHLLISIVISLLIIIIVFFVFSKFSKPVQFYHYDELKFELTISEKYEVGLQGENAAFMFIKSFLNDGYLLRNLLVPKQNGEFGEIDCVLISKKGIFCIEVKNWGGNIIGGNKDKVWRQVFKTGSRLDKYMRNPVKQNQEHCNILERILNYTVAVDNIVIFVNQKKLTCIQSKNVFTLNTFKKCYESLDEDQLTPSQVNKIASDLKLFVSSNIEILQYSKKMESLHSSKQIY